MEVIRKNWIFLFLLFWMTLMLWVCGSVMRESDQASLLRGALILARDSSVKPDFHNYSGQFGSYWLLAALQKLFPSESLKEYVTWGNMVTCGLFLASLVVYTGSFWGTFRKRDGTAMNRHRGLLMFVCLTTPTVILSVPLLSSNVLAGAFILVLISTSKWWRERWGVFVGAIFVFCAVCLRQDAAFLLPLVCFMPQKELSFKGLTKERYFWVFVTSAVCAVLLGKGISPSRYIPGLVLDWRLIGCYTVFGLLGGGLVIFWVVLKVRRASMDFFTRLILIAAILLPVLMYILLLYSPRHFFMAGLVPLILASSQWLKFDQDQRRSFSNLLYLAVAINICWLLIAPQVQKNGTVKLSTTYATCYPTADGLWPIGGGLHFLYRLKNADQEYRAIDHNQEIWGVWEDWFPKEEAVSVGCTTLGAYTDLWNVLHTFQAEAASSNFKKVTVHTDRDWLGLGSRQATRFAQKRNLPQLIFTEEKIIRTSRNRIIFSDIKIGESEVDFKVHKARALLIKAYPKTEFLSVKKRNQGDGHLYVDKDGKLYKSNYPEIILKYF